MSDGSVSLIDAVYSARLSVAGLPALSNVQKEQTGVAPAVDPYAAPSSTLTTLSGYGQLLSAASRTAEGLQQLLGESTNLATSDNEAVATVTATDEATAATYSVLVDQKATAQNLTSGFFGSKTEQIFSAGSFSLSVGGGTAVTVEIGETSGLLGDSGYAWGSLQSMANAINNANGSVSATIIEDASYGFQLKLTARDTGSSNTISLVASNDPLDSGGASNLTALGFTQSQAAQDAKYTVGTGTQQSSASNSDITLATGVNLNIVSASPAPVTINVTSTPTLSVSTDNIQAAATQLVQSYNALIGTVSQLTETDGALAGDATATAFKISLSGIAADLTTRIDDFSKDAGTGALTISSSFMPDATDAETLSDVVSDLYSLVSSYLGTSGMILSQAKTTQQNIAYSNLDTQAYSNLAADIKQYVLQKSLSSASVPTGLPDLSVFT